MGLDEEELLDDPEEEHGDHDIEIEDIEEGAHQQEEMDIR